MTAAQLHQKRLHTLSTLEPGLTLIEVKTILKCGEATARKLCNGTYKLPHWEILSILGNSKRLKFYQGLDWSKGTAWLRKKHKISRQSLSFARQQLDFKQLFEGRKKLSYEQCVKEMRELQQQRKKDSPKKPGRPFKDLTAEQFVRSYRLLGIGK